MEAKQELVIFDVEPEERTEKWMQQLPDRVCKIYREIAERRTQNDAFALIQENFQKNKVYLHEYFPTIHTVFDDILVPESLGEFQVKRINITGKYRGVTIEFKKLVEKLISDVEEQARLLSISMNRMEKALKSSKFELLDWMDILESYFGQKIIWKQEVLQRENEKQKVLLKHIEHGITKLPVFCTKKERLAVYAAQVTGVPHFFDSNTFAELLLFDFITYHFHTNNEESILESYEL